MYQITLESFSGPLEKLLELIEQKKLDITSISLAEVTADFIAYTQELKKAYEEQAVQGENAESLRIYAQSVSDFLVVASQLILIKSRALLPQLELSGDEEGETFDLERQLQLYGDMKPVFAELKKFWAGSERSFARDYLRTVQPVFYPPSGLTLAQMQEALERITNTLGTLVREEQKIERQIVTLEEKIKDLSDRVLQGVQKFSSLVSEKTKHETIVIFLALLHLLRDRRVHARQEGQFGDIEFDQAADTESTAQPELV